MYTSTTMRKTLTQYLIILFVLFFFAAAFASNDKLDHIVAIVNDQVITQSELDRAVDDALAQQKAAPNAPTVNAAEIRTATLNNLINQDIEAQAAKTMGMTVSDEDLNLALTTIAQQHQISVAQLPAAVEKSGIPFNKFKDQLKTQLLTQKLQQAQLMDSIHINPKEVDKLAQKLAKTPIQNASVAMLYHFKEIFIPLSATPSPQEITAAKQKFDAIANALNQGQNFDILSVSILGKGATDLGWRSTEQLPPQFVQTAVKMHVGDVAPPARGPDGLHILKLVETKKADQNNDNVISDTITETHVRHILLKKDALTPNSTLERRLVALRNHILHGSDFAKVAEENSQDPGSVANGGDIDWVKPGVLDPKFEAAMNKLKINEISQPIQTQFGWHLIQVLGRRQIQDKQAALKLRAQQIIFQQKLAEAQKELISQLRAQAYIKTFNANTN